MTPLRLIHKSPLRLHIDTCAKYLVDNDLVWFSEAQEYLSLYWENHQMSSYFQDYREFLEEVSHTMNWILLGHKTAPRQALRLAGGTNSQSAHPPKPHLSEE
jgi:hypothetical protein